MPSINNEAIQEKLEIIIALLKFLTYNAAFDRKRTILTTPKKREIYDLCTGTNDTTMIREKADVSKEYVRLTIKDLEDAGLILLKVQKGRRYPKRVV